MPFVLDCSVALAWVMPDEADEQVDILLDRLLDDSAVVPELWSLEVGNVLLVARRRNRITDDEQVRIMADLCNLPVETDRRTHEEWIDNAARRVWSCCPIPFSVESGVSDGLRYESEDSERNR